MGCPDNANHSATRPFVICAARHFDASRETQDVQLCVKQHTICFRTRYNEANLTVNVIWSEIREGIEWCCFAKFQCFDGSYQKPQVEDEPKTVRVQ